MCEGQYTNTDLDLLPWLREAVTSGSLDKGSCVKYTTKSGRKMNIVVTGDPSRPVSLFAFECTGIATSNYQRTGPCCDPCRRHWQSNNNVKKSITKPNNLVTVAGADTFLTTGPDSSGYERIGATTVSKLNSTNQETVLNYLIEKTRDEYSLVSVLFVFPVYNCCCVVVMQYVDIYPTLCSLYMFIIDWRYISI